MRGLSDLRPVGSKRRRFFGRAARRIFGDPFVRRTKYLRFEVGVRLGIRAWTSTGLNGLDQKVMRHLDTRTPGIFVELGANDGVQQSNTLGLERLFGWRGVLIEAIPQLAVECRRNRPNATVICSAVTSRALSGSLLGLRYSDLRTSIGDATHHCPAVTLTSILEAMIDGKSIDFLSLDVEGHELKVLDGLDLERFAPQWMLIETDQPDEIAAHLGSAYVFVERLSFHDYLYELVDPQLRSNREG